MKQGDLATVITEAFLKHDSVFSGPRFLKTLTEITEEYGDAVEVKASSESLNAGYAGTGTGATRNRRNTTTNMTPEEKNKYHYLCFCCQGSYTCLRGQPCKWDKSGGRRNLCQGCGSDQHRNAECPNVEFQAIRAKNKQLRSGSAEQRGSRQSHQTRAEKAEKDLSDLRAKYASLEQSKKDQAKHMETLKSQVAAAGSPQSQQDLLDFTGLEGVEETKGP